MYYELHQSDTGNWYFTQVYHDKRGDRHPDMLTKSREYPTHREAYDAAHANRVSLLRPDAPIRRPGVAA